MKKRKRKLEKVHSRNAECVDVDINQYLVREVSSLHLVAHDGHLVSLRDSAECNGVFI